MAHHLEGSNQLDRVDELTIGVYDRDFGSKPILPSSKTLRNGRPTITYNPHYFPSKRLRKQVEAGGLG